MNKSRIVQPSLFQRLVTENLARWNVITRTVPGEAYRWVVINSDEPMIGPAPPLVSSKNDWSTTVDYWSSDRPYRAFIPSNSGNDANFPAGPWVSHWGVRNHRMRWSLTLDTRKTIFRIREDTRKIIDALISTYNLKCTFPPVLSLRWLGDQFYTEETLAVKVAEARYHILEQYGFIAFHIKKRPCWRTHPNLSTVKDLIISAGLSECTHRGCIVDFKKLAFDELYMLIEHRVPIHYQWFPTDVGPFDPKWLKAKDYDELRRPRDKSFSPEEHQVITLPAAGKGTFYRVSSSGERTEVSRKEYKRWAFWCATKSEQSPSGEIFLVFQDISDDNAEVDVIDVDLAAVNTEVSQDEGESSSAHIEELEPDHGAHETSPTALSQEELDLAAGFLNDLGQERSSSIVAELTARTATHHSPRAPSPPGDERVMLQEGGPSRKRTLSVSSSSTPEAKRHCGVEQLISEAPALLQDSPIPDVGVSPSSAPEVTEDTSSSTPIPQQLSQL